MKGRFEDDFTTSVRLTHVKLSFFKLKVLQCQQFLKVKPNSLNNWVNGNNNS